jgi:pilus assembly protein Flp/PilA
VEALQARKQQPTPPATSSVKDPQLTQLYICGAIVGVANHPTGPEEEVVKRILLRFLSDESGATAIEYGLIAAGIALAIIAVVNGVGTNLNAQFTSINSSLK